MEQSEKELALSPAWSTKTSLVERGKVRVKTKMIFTLTFLFDLDEKWGLIIQFKEVPDHHPHPGKALNVYYVLLNPKKSCSTIWIVCILLDPGLLSSYKIFNFE